LRPTGSGDYRSLRRVSARPPGLSVRRNTYGGRVLLADLLPIKAIDSGRRERGCRLLGTSYARREREVSVAVPIQEILELTRGFLFRDPVPLLGSASELIAPPAELTLWIIGEPAPLFFHFPRRTASSCLRNGPDSCRSPAVTHYRCGNSLPPEMCGLCANVHMV
jgi:hypothetical protein